MFLFHSLYLSFFFFNATATTEIYTLSLHDLFRSRPSFFPTNAGGNHKNLFARARSDRKSTRLNSSHEWISYAVFCLKKKNRHQKKYFFKKDNFKNKIAEHELVGILNEISPVLENP